MAGRMNRNSAVESQANEKGRDEACESVSQSTAIIDLPEMCEMSV